MARLLLAFVVAWIGWTSVARADTYSITGTDVTTPAPGVVRTQHHVQITTSAGAVNPLNRINVTRIRNAHGHLRGPLLLAGAFGFGVEYYEVTETPLYRASWAGVFATAGYDVWVVDDRTTKGVPPDGCSSGAFDCSVMADWGTPAEVRDIEFTRSLIRGVWGSSVEPVVGGNVGGAIYALAAINSFPTHYAGVLAWQGAPFTTAAATRALNQSFCDLTKFLLSVGIVADGSNGPFIAFILDVEAHPGAPAPILSPAQPPNLTNHQAFVWLLSNTLPNNPNFPTPNYLLANGNYVQDRFFFLSEARLAKVNPLFTNLLSVAQFRDFTCAISGEDTSTYANLGAYHGKIYLQGSDRAFGPLLADTATLLTGASVTLRLDDHNRGELDEYFSRDRFFLADLPMLAWLRTVDFTP